MKSLADQLQELGIVLDEPEKFEAAFQRLRCLDLHMTANLDGTVYLDTPATLPGDVTAAVDSAIEWINRFIREGYLRVVGGRLEAGERPFPQDQSPLRLSKIDAAAIGVLLIAGGAFLAVLGAMLLYTAFPPAMVLGLIFLLIYFVMAAIGFALIWHATTNGVLVYVGPGRPPKIEVRGA